MKTLQFAIPKGSLGKNTQRILNEAGFNLRWSERSYRPGIGDSEIKIKVLRPQEIPTMIAQGAHDLGIKICYEPRCEIVHDHGFDLEYEKVRTDILNNLISHIVSWKKHKKLLLPPSSLRLFYFLFKHNIPMWVSKKNMLPSFITQIQRRVLNEYFNRRYGVIWPSIEEGERVTKKIMRDIYI